MRGVYTTSIKISGLNSARTLWYGTAATNRPVEILSVSVTDANNETNEQCECVLQAIGTLGTPTATTLTPAKHEQGDQAAAGTYKGNVTASEPTYTADTEIGREGFPSLGGYRFQPVPEERPIIQGGTSTGLRMLNAPAAFDAIVSVTFREIG